MLAMIPDVSPLYLGVSENWVYTTWLFFLLGMCIYDNNNACYSLRLEITMPICKEYSFPLWSTLYRSGVEICFSEHSRASDITFHHQVARTLYMINLM